MLNVALTVLKLENWKDLLQTTEHKSRGISQAPLQILFGNKDNQLESASKFYQEISRKFAATTYIQKDVLFQAESVLRCSF